MVRVPTRRQTVAGVAALAAAASLATVGITSATATTSSLFAVTAVSPHLVAATTANQVITLTGTGFDEAAIKSIAVAGCTAPTYIVVNPTTLVIKTDATCTAGTNKAITITDQSNATYVTTPATVAGQVLSFVTAPVIATASATVRPVVTNATSGQAYANQVTSASTKGGAVIRVNAGAAGWTSSASLPLSATLDGVALTSITLGSGTPATYFTGVVGAHAADAAPVLKITQNGVSKSFVYGAGGASAVDQTFDFTYAGASIAVSPSFGPSNGGNTLTVTGTGFTAATTVTVGTQTCVKVSQAATSFVCTVPKALTPFVGPVTVTATTGSLVSIVGSGSTYTYTAE